MPEARAYLEDVPLLAGLSPAARDQLAAGFEPFSCPAGARLFRQEERGDGLYVLASGTVALRARTPGDGTVELSRIAPGSSFGEFCLLDAGHRSAEALAIEASSGWRLPLTHFDGMRRTGSVAAADLLDLLRREVAQSMRNTLSSLASAAATVVRPFPAVAPVDAGTAPDDCERLLCSFPGFDRFSPAEWEAFAALARRRDLPRGALLAPAGAASDALHVVARGAVRAGLPVQRGVSQMLIHGPGALAGIAAFIDGGDWPLALDVREAAVVFTLAPANCAALPEPMQSLLGEHLTCDLRRLSRVIGRAQALNGQIA